MSESHLNFIQPDHFAAPRGYANGVLAQGHQLFVGGQIGWQADQSFASDDFVDQFATALDNVLAVVHKAGGQATDIANMTIFATDLDAYRNAGKALSTVWKERMGRHYPAMALVGVNALVEKRAKVEIQAQAMIQAGPQGD